MPVEIDMHRWYAVVKEDGRPDKVIGATAPFDGLVLYDSVEEWREANS